MVSPEATDLNKQTKESTSTRTNEHLLTVDKLQHQKNASETSRDVTIDLEQDSCELPFPPSYESIVRFDGHVDTVSLPSTSQLPKYKDVVLKDAPPSYQSLFTDRVLRVMNPFTDGGEPVLEVTAGMTTSKVTTFCLNVLLLFVLISFVLILPVSMITIGIVFIHKCPVQPRIPVYLIVLGFFQMLECCGRLAYKLFQGSPNQNSWRERYRRKDPLVYFVIVWFVIGSMWVYQTNPDCKDCKLVSIPNNITTATTTLNTTSTLYSHSTVTTDITSNSKPLESVMYCSKLLYSFAFWVITTYYSIIGFFCVLILIDVTLRAINRCCCSCRQDRTS